MPGKSKTSLKMLQTRQRGLQTSFNNMLKFMEAYTDETNITEVKVRLDQLDQLWDRMNENIEEVEAHEESTADPDSFAKVRIDFENRFYNLKSFLLDKDLPDIEKFHYLRSQLEGEALAVIDSLPLTRANYVVAWELICNRYSNSKTLRKRQVQALFELPVVRKESSADLHTLLDSYEKIVKSLDQATPNAADFKDLLLLHLLSSRLDSATRRSWEEYTSTMETDTVKELTDFLQRRIHILESLPTRSVEQRIDTSSSKFTKRSNVVKVCNTTIQSSAPIKCVVCTDSHLLYQCPQFLKLPVSERDGLLRSHSLCRNCFRRGHQARDCNSKFTCRQCRGKHHTLVCFKGKADDKRSSNTTESTTNTVESAEEPTNTKVVNVAATTSAISNAATGSPTGVLLLTAIVLLKDEGGNIVHARALLDSASECNLITKQMRNQLSVKEDPSTVQVVGIHGTSNKVHGKVSVTVRSRNSNFAQDMEFYVMPKITAQPGMASVNPNDWNLLAGIELADPNFAISKPIDLVLGAEFFFDLFVSGRRMSIGEKLPLLIDSVFGWIATGRFPMDSPITTVLCDVAVSSHLDKLIERFWEYEEIGLENSMSPDEAKCEEYFTQTIQRQSSGRYSVSLPRKDELLRNLGDSKASAERRFLQIERRLNRDSSLREQYVSFMAEYEALGHMSRVAEVDIGTGRCYLPHHPVVKEGSTTTRVRVVFDASARTDTGLSLNDCLYSGPIIQRDIRSIILRSRFRPIMLVADVEKMFRQVDICPEDRQLQSILWRSSPDLPLATFQLNTVTYGTKPAPFLATRTLVQLATDEATRFPLAAAAVKEDFYIDDAITGADDPATAKELRIQLVDMLSSGGFKLRKFASNCSAVLEGLPSEDLSLQAEEGIYLDPDPMVKTLGLIWMPPTDEFRFHFKAPPLPEFPLTKRKIFSIIASLFDPLGFVGAVLTRAKLIMQLSWQLLDDNGQKLSWNSSMPYKIEADFRKFYQQIPLLNELRIERLVIIPQARHIQLHIFSDASERAFGACVYVRTEDASGRTKVALLLSKSRVAPLKTQTIPRLELRAATLAAEMYSQFKDSMDFFFWTDSEIVLRWCAATPSTWTTFVANRVAKIQRLTENCHWYHVPGEKNPADLISRGISPEEILQNQLWWEVDWLQAGVEYWPKQKVFMASGIEEERRRVVLSTRESDLSFIADYIARYSTYTTMVRHLAWWYRYLHNLQVKREDRQFGPLTAVDLLCAETTIIQRVQREMFPTELKAISKGEGVSRRSPLRWYYPFVSNEETWEIGRDETSNYSSVHGRTTYTKSCTSKTIFDNGVDYFGPIYVRPGYRRTPVKAYVAVFVCFSTKAVHLELATDLSTACFIQALRRFISRRGKCAKLFSDNGTNFVGARNAMEKLLQNLRSREYNEAVSRWCADEGMQWSFIPPGAPHFGGLWESAVRSTKVHLLKVLGETAVSYEDMTTLLAQVECCLNSRPLTPLSDDPNDLEALTPGHFLVTTSLQAIPEEDLTNIPTGRLQHRELIQQCLQFYWKRWRSEYLTMLQARMKWWQPAKEIKIGSLVVIRDENQPPTRWRMARIHAVHPGDDNVVRVVTLKTVDGFIKRPVSKICFLPVASPMETDETNAELTSETPAASEAGRMLRTTL
ncbi:uncharacterized protein LOC134202744 [Armigeres subalbatus]|uniref:uncharacterized protein LOC134202744 n=1 Tax=Armigeres subalbatus TaxID=124917 RepID=UPI002ED44272